MSEANAACPICRTPAEPLGAFTGKYIKTEFRFQRCPACMFSFITNPYTDYAKIYDDNYYLGKGADPAVDYAFELSNPEDTVRYYEWRGILKAVSALTTVNANTKWLEFGCGNGGLVRHVCANSPCKAIGFDEGAITREVKARGIPFLEKSDLEKHFGTFDVVTAIEVIEHVIDPVDCLKFIRKLLKPGGLLFLTTGNAQPFRNKFFSWAYIVPELHVSYFEPQSLSKALELAGFRPEVIPPPPGFKDVIRFKILKNLGIRKRSIFEKALPWTLLSWMADQKFKVSAHPIGWASTT